jgi:hypothetical protein
MEIWKNRSEWQFVIGMVESNDHASSSSSYEKIGDLENQQIWEKSWPAGNQQTCFDHQNDIASGVIDLPKTVVEERPEKRPARLC